MKKILILILTATVFVLSSGGCHSSQHNSPHNSVKGKVSRIERGKDGYTAQVKTDDGQTFSAVVSSVNLAGSAQYKEVQVGDTIERTHRATGER